MKKSISIAYSVVLFTAISASPQYVEARKSFSWEMFIPAITGTHAVTPGLSGYWAGQWQVTYPADPDCAFSRAWTASITETNGHMSGFFSGGTYSGSILGMWDGVSNASWFVNGSDGLRFIGKVSGTSISGTWSNGWDCFDVDTGNNLGPTSGTFSGAKQ